jgi:hypothetical protein
MAPKRQRSKSPKGRETLDGGAKEMSQVDFLALKITAFRLLLVLSLLPKIARRTDNPDAEAISRVIEEVVRLLCAGAGGVFGKDFSDSVLARMAFVNTMETNDLVDVGLALEDEVLAG